MPPVGAAIAAAVTEYAASITLGSILTSVATSLVLSGLQRLIAGSPDTGGGQRIKNSGITQQIKQPIIDRKPVYGEVRRSGGLLYIGMSDDNKYLHLVIEVAPHEVQEIGEVWLNDYSIPPDHLDGDGNVTQGRYQDLVRIRPHLGTDSQAADSFLVSEVAEITSSFRLRGVAYVYARYEWDNDAFPTGVPNLSAWLSGKKVYDPRTTTTYYSDNIGLIVNDYMTDDKFGLEAADADIEQTYLTAAANACDEFVTTTNYAVTVLDVQDDGGSPIDYTDIFEVDEETLFLQRGDRVQVTTTGTLPTGLSLATNYYVIPYQRVAVEGVQARIKLAASLSDALAGTAIDITSAGTGTHTITKNAEPRYTGGATIDSTATIKENLENLLSGMSGMISYSAGQYRIFAGAYQTPTVYFDEDNIKSAITVQTKVSKRERFNVVRGVYTSPINNNEPADYPEVRNSTYITEDGEEIVKQIDMPITSRPHTAQRIAKINLELSRQEITWSADFDLSALQVVAGDNAYFTFDTYGWTDKIFQIKNWKWNPKEIDGVVVPLIRMEMREIASANYDWNNGEETSVDPAPNSTLPDVFNVSPPTLMTITAKEIGTQQGDLTYEFLIGWTAPADLFVVNGGYYEVEFKKSSETDWLRSYRAEGNDTNVTVKQIQPGVNYDARIRSVNALGVKSDYLNNFGFTISSPSGATISIDYGDTLGAVVDTIDYGDTTDSVDDTLDFGSTV